MRISIRSLYQVARERQLVGISYWYLLLALVVIVTVVGLFSEIADEVLEAKPLAVDTAVLTWLQGFRNPELNAFMSIATDAGGTIGVSLALVAATTLLVRMRRWLATQLLLIGVLGAAAINLGLKVLFARQRPDELLRLIEEASYSFPSGHAMASSALALSLALIAWHSRWRWWVLSLATAYTLFIGISRIYLGVHYPTDIVAGWLVSAAWVVVVAVVLGIVNFRLSSTQK